MPMSTKLRVRKHLNEEVSVWNSKQNPTGEPCVCFHDLETGNITETMTLEEFEVSGFFPIGQGKKAMLAAYLDAGLPLPAFLQRRGPGGRPLHEHPGKGGPADPPTGDEDDEE
jgi:hypothetical protein